MTLAELLPALHGLPRADKLRVIQFLASDLARRIGRFTPVRLAFAWSRSNRVPVMLGQVNFFMEFDVWFSRSRFFFEIRPKDILGD